MSRLLQRLAVALWLVSASPPAHAERMELLVPAYQYPTLGTLWSQLATAASQVPVTAIADPANGPGAAVDPAYTSVIQTLRSAGGRVLGYVSTHYATIDSAQVFADAERFAAFYPLDGFFLDEMTSDASHVPYYAALSRRLRQAHPTFRLVANPGTACDAGYLAATSLDALVTYENSAGYAEATPPAWTHAFAPSRFVNLFYRVSDSAGMASVLALARERHVACVYVTDDSLANPWDTLPPYWSAQVALVAAWTVGPAPADAPLPPLAAGLRVLGSPAYGAIAFRCGASPHTRALTLFDAQGRAVRRMAVEPLQAAMRWDGRDGRGQRAAAGVYFARLSGDSAVARGVLLH